MGSVQDFMDKEAGERLPAFKFTNVGDGVIGTVRRADVHDVSIIGKSGEKEPQLLIELDTDEEYTQSGTDKKTGAPIVITGKEWSVWVKRNSQLLGALNEQLKAANAPPDSPHPGDRISIVFASTEPSKTSGFNPKKVYEVGYKVGPGKTMASASSGISVKDL